jgi:DNA-directed RNA polymerase specialized sigma24 family protein
MLRTSRFGTFLFTSLKNHVLNKIRDRENKILSGYVLGEESHLRKNSTGDDINYAEYQHIIQQGLAELPVRKRKVFEMRSLNGLFKSEVAELMLLSSPLCRLTSVIGLITMK